MKNNNNNNKSTRILESERIKLESLQKLVVQTRFKDNKINDEYNTYFKSLIQKYNIGRGYSIDSISGEIILMNK